MISFVLCVTICVAVCVCVGIGIVFYQSVVRMGVFQNQYYIDVSIGHRHRYSKFPPQHLWYRDQFDDDGVHQSIIDRQQRVVDSPRHKWRPCVMTMTMMTTAASIASPPSLNRHHDKYIWIPDRGP